VVANPDLLERFHPDKLAPAPDTVPGRFERGTPPLADFAGVVAAVEHLAALDSAATGSRRGRILASMVAVERHEATLFEILAEGLSAMSDVVTYSKAALRAPTAYFNVVGWAPHEVAERLAARGVNVWSGDNYAWELAGVLGIRGNGGAVRAGLVHYNDDSDCRRLLEALSELAGASRRPSR
jgi:selenocysteine lyase/cysteine desulfurase